MSALSGERILHQLHRRFKTSTSASGGATKEEFIGIILPVLSEYRATHGDDVTVAQLLEKFYEIDVDGDGHCSWDVRAHPLSQLAPC